MHPELAIPWHAAYFLFAAETDLPVRQSVLPRAKTGSSQHLKNGDPKVAAITPEIVNPVA